MSAPLEPGEPQVGAFRRGSGLSRAALARYLVARVITEAVGRSMMVLALVLTLVAALVFFLWMKWLGVLIFVGAVAVLAFRALFLAILRRLAGPLGSAEERIRGLVADSRADFGRELKRVGLPGSMLGLPLLALRLLGRRRADTLARLGRVDLARVVPPSRLDELHLIVANDVLARGERPRRREAG
jgi:hypothetical protein